jgi:D-aminopeptidase
MKLRLYPALALAALLPGATGQGADPRPRARDLGLAPGVFPPGPLNAITDVAGVRVGQVTLVEGERVRTGVTVVVPHGGDLFREKVPAGIFVGNGFGKLAGSTQVNELGTLETPIALTNTLDVSAAVRGLVAATLARPGNEDVRSVNAVVGETNDGRLNDIRGEHVKPPHVLAALQAASGGAVAEGNVGAGTGTQCFGWKCGIGTASRVLPARFGGYTLGVLVQANFGGVLSLDGVPVGKELGKHEYATSRAGGAFPSPRATDSLRRERLTTTHAQPERPIEGSCMIVVATDAPLDARELRRLATRAVFALARTGSSFSSGSGDYAIAFSTAPELRVRHGDTAVAPRPLLPSDAVSPLFQAVLETTEEAVYNALLRSETTRANGVTVEAIPIDTVRALLRKYGR